MLILNYPKSKSVFKDYIFAKIQVNCQTQDILIEMF